MLSLGLMNNRFGLLLGEIISSQTVVVVDSFNNTSSTVEVRQPSAESGLWETPGNSLIVTKGIDGNSLLVISVKVC